MAGYSARQEVYTTGDIVEAADTNNEFNAILAAFDATTGHTHSGAAGQGGPISVTAATGTLPVAHGGTGAVTHTDGGLLIGKGTAAFENTGVLADGTIVIGDGATNPTTLAAFTSATGTLKVANGGTAIATYTIGDILYASAAGVLSKLAAVATGSVLKSAGVATAPAWGTLAQADISGLTTASNVQFNTVGIGVAANSGVPLYVKDGVSGATIDTSAAVWIEGGAGTYIAINAPDANYSGVYGYGATSSVWGVDGKYSTGEMRIYTQKSTGAMILHAGAVRETMRLTAGAASTGKVFIGDGSIVTESTMTQGLVIVGTGSAATGTVLSFKGTSVAHTITNEEEATTFGGFTASSTTLGGLNQFSYSESTAGNSYRMYAVTNTPDSTHTSGGNGVINLVGQKKSGATSAAVGGGANIVTIQSGGQTEFIFTGGGTQYSHVGGVSPTDFDEHDDALLVHYLNESYGKRTNGSQLLALDSIDAITLPSITTDENGEHTVGDSMENTRVVSRIHNGNMNQMRKQIEVLTAVIEEYLPGVLATTNERYEQIHGESPGMIGFAHRAAQVVDAQTWSLADTIDANIDNAIFDLKAQITEGNI